MKMPLGKVSIDVLEKYVFPFLGEKYKEVVLGPTVGCDGAIIDIGKNSLITSMDPITGAIEQIGWLAVNINANDIATFGVKPRYFLSSILLPKKSNKQTVKKICEQMDCAAKEVGIAIIGGHCELNAVVKNPIVIGCGIGITKKGKYVTAGGAQTGDKLILTKSAGIEGTAILAADRKEQLERIVGVHLLNNAKQFYKQISIVNDAITAFQTGGVNAMHDPTEGGVIGGIHEMADASNKGVLVLEQRIHIQTETKKICAFFKIDPLQLISSGSLLISAKQEFTDKIIGALKQKQIDASIIGEFLENTRDRLIVRKDGAREPLIRPSADHLWLVV